MKLTLALFAAALTAQVPRPPAAARPGAISYLCNYWKLDERSRFACALYAASLALPAGTRAVSVVPATAVATCPLDGVIETLNPQGPDKTVLLPKEVCPAL